MRHYATDEDTGERFLRYISCDHGCCPEKIKPHPEISSSGWTKKGGTNPPHRPEDKRENDYCPEHS